jgi:hypothetical protein
MAWRVSRGMAVGDSLIASISSFPSGILEAVIRSSSNCRSVEVISACRSWVYDPSTAQGSAAPGQAILIV